MDVYSPATTTEERNWAAEVEQLKGNEDSPQGSPALPENSVEGDEEEEEEEWRTETSDTQQEVLPQQALEQLQLDSGNSGEEAQAAAEEQQKLQEFFLKSFQKSATSESLHHTEATAAAPEEGSPQEGSTPAAELTPPPAAEETPPTPPSSSPPTAPAKVSPPIQVAAILPTIGASKKVTQPSVSTLPLQKPVNSHHPNLGLKLPLQVTHPPNLPKYSRNNSAGIHPAPPSNLIGSPLAHTKSFLSQTVPSSNYCSIPTSYAKAHLEYQPTLIQAAIPPQRFQHLRDQHYLLSSSPKDNAQALRQDLQLGTPYGPNPPSLPESHMAHHLGHPDSMGHLTHLQPSGARVMSLPTYVPSTPNSFGPTAFSYVPYRPAAAPNYRHPGEAADPTSPHYGQPLTYNSVTSPPVMGSSQSFKVVDPRLMGLPPPPIVPTSTATAAQLYQQYNMNVNMLNTWYSRTMQSLGLQLKEGLGALSDANKMAAMQQEASQNKVQMEPIYLHNMLSYAQPPPPHPIATHYLGQEFVRTGMPEFVAADPRAFLHQPAGVKVEKLVVQQQTVRDVVARVPDTGAKMDPTPLLVLPPPPAQNLYPQPAFKEAKMTNLQTAAEMAIAKALHNKPPEELKVDKMAVPKGGGYNPPNSPPHKPSEVQSDNEVRGGTYANNTWSPKAGSSEGSHHYNHSKNWRSHEEDKSGARGGGHRRGGGGNFHRSNNNNNPSRGYRGGGNPPNSDPRFRERVYQRKDSQQQPHYKGNSRSQERMTDDKT